MVFPGWFTENHVGGAGNGTPEHSTPFRFQTDPACPRIPASAVHTTATPGSAGSVAPAAHQPGSVVPNPSPRGSQPVPFHVLLGSRAYSYKKTKRSEGNTCLDNPPRLGSLGLNPLLGDKEKSPRARDSVRHCVLRGRWVRPVWNGFLHGPHPAPTIGTALTLPRVAALDIIVVRMVFTAFQVTVSTFSPANVGSCHFLLR